MHRLAHTKPKVFFFFADDMMMLRPGNLKPNNTTNLFWPRPLFFWRGEKEIGMRCTSGIVFCWVINFCYISVSIQHSHRLYSRLRHPNLELIEAAFSSPLFSSPLTNQCKLCHSCATFLKQEESRGADCFATDIWSWSRLSAQEEIRAPHIAAYFPRTFQKKRIFRNFF